VRVDAIALLSNNADVTLNPERLRKLAGYGEGVIAPVEAPSYRVHRLSRRLGTENVAEVA
jgi:hypothetical protein